MHTSRRACIALAIAGAAVAVLAPRAQAMTFDSTQGFDDMVAGATLVVRGQVLALTDMQAHVSGSIPVPYTAITLKVSQNFAGSSAGATITLRQIGGRIAGQPNRLMVFPGLADFQVGDEVYVIADDRRQPFFATLYGDQGLYRVATDPLGQQRVLSEGWQVMTTGGLPWRSADQRFCNPVPTDRRRCTLVTEAAFDTSSDSAKPPPSTDLTPATFEARLRSLRTGKPVLPGQTVSGNAAQFEAALAALRLRGLQAATAHATTGSPR